MGKRKVTMTLEQHIIHGQRLRSAYSSIMDLRSELYYAAPKGDQIHGFVNRADTAVTMLRYEMEALALVDGVVEITSFIPSTGRPLYAAASSSDLWYPGQPLGASERVTIASTSA